MARARHGICAAGAALGLLLAGVPAGAQTVLDFLPQTIPGYDARLGVPLLARAQSRLRDLGMEIGPLTVHPAAELGIGYDSNVLSTSNGRGSGFGAIRGNILATAAPEDARLAGFAAVDNVSFVSAAPQDRTNWSVAQGSAVPLAGGTLTIAGAHVSQHQDRSDVEARPSDTPIAFRVEDLRALYSYRLNRLTLAPNIEFAVYRFSNTTIFGIPASQAFRDRNALSGGLSARYELTGDNALMFAARGLGVHYTQPQPGAPSQDSTGATFLAGMASVGPGIWQYSVLAGVEARSFAARQYATRAVPVVDAQLLWLPSGLTSVSARVTRAIEESAWLNSAGNVMTWMRIGLEHEYLRNVILQGYSGLAIAQPLNGGPMKASLNGGGRIVWLANRNVQVSLSYDVARWNETVAANGPHDTTRLRNLVLASVRVMP